MRNPAPEHITGNTLGAMRCTAVVGVGGIINVRKTQGALVHRVKGRREKKKRLLALHFEGLEHWCGTACASWQRDGTGTGTGTRQFVHLTARGVGA